MEENKKEISSNLSVLYTIVWLDRRHSSINILH